MGVSTDGILCFGVQFEEGFEFPWEDYDEDEWWLKATGYKPPFELYDESGEYIEGVKPTQSQIEEYHNAQSKWQDEHPKPFEVVNYCSDSCPAFILAVPSSVITARRGYPEEVPTTLKVAPEAVELLTAFIKRYIPDATGHEPKWWLCSYWG